MAFPLIHAEELKAFYDQEMTAWINNNYPMEGDRNTLLFSTENPVAPNISFTVGLNWRDFFESTATTTVPNAASGDASLQSFQLRRNAIVTGSTVVDLISGHASLECTRWRKISVTRTLNGSAPFPATQVETRSARAGRLLTTYRAPGFRNPWSYVYVSRSFTVNYDNLVRYMVDIRNEWKRVAVDSAFVLSGTVCHASCHASCHNSRGRR